MFNAILGKLLAPSAEKIGDQSLHEPVSSKPLLNE